MCPIVNMVCSALLEGHSKRQGARAARRGAMHGLVAAFSLVCWLVAVIATHCHQDIVQHWEVALDSGFALPGKSAARDNTAGEDGQ
jgi:hypothetical protein